MPKWQDVGSGFSGMKRLISPTKSLTKENIEDDIDVDKTPDAKKKGKRNRVIRSHSCHQNTIFSSGAAANDIQDIDWSDSSGEDDIVLTQSHQESKKRKEAQNANQSLPKNKQPSSSFLADNPSSNDIISQCSSVSDEAVLNKSKTIFVHDYKPSRNIISIATKEQYAKISPRLGAVRKLYQDVEIPNENISDIASDTEGTYSDDASVASDVSEQYGHEMRKMGEHKKQLLSQSQTIDSQSTSPNSYLKSQQDGRKPSSLATEPSCEPISPQSSPSKEGIRASEWVSVLIKSRTPGKAARAVEETGHDSAKKKSKFSRGSLAGQLSTIISREKSAVCFWHHSSKEGAVNGGNSKAIEVEILNFRRHLSFYVCKCQMQTSHVEKYKVLLLCETFENLKLKLGSRIQICPPWQQLVETSGERTLLCTQYVKVISHPELSQLPLAVTKKDDWLLHAKWQCPCLKDSGAIVKPKCSTVFNPDILAINHNKKQSITLSNNHKPSASQCRLQAVVSDALPEDNTKGSDHHTLLGALEKAGTTSSQVPPFSALVLRIFEYIDAPRSSKRYEVLVEDQGGTVALIEDFGEDLTENPMSMLEGTVFMCQGMSVVSRTNEEKEPALFSIVGQAWVPRVGESTQLSEQDGSGQTSSNPPSFGYILKSHLSVISALTPLYPRGDDGHGSLESREIQVCFNQNEFLKSDARRLNILAQVVHICYSLSQNAPQQQSTFVLLPSGCATELYSHILDVSHLCGGQWELSNATTPTPFFLRDVQVEEGELHCDQYSLCVPLPALEALGLTSRLPSHLIDAVCRQPFVFASVSEECKVGTLLLVEGTICDVDEESSTSLEVCQYCSSDQLTYQHESMWCLVCQCAVPRPRVKVEMGVFLRCDELNPQVKVQLHEKTITSLLPHDLFEEECDGYDIDNVLGKQLCLPVCVVVSAAHCHGSIRICLKELNFNA